MRKLIVLLFLAAPVLAAPVGEDAAGAVAATRILRDGMAGVVFITDCTDIESAGGEAILARAFGLSPSGYVIVSADDALPPVIAYSYNGSLDGPDGSFGIIDLVRFDLEGRLACADGMTGESAGVCRALWAAYLSGDAAAVSGTDLEQWPPAGTTPTGGWLEENWTQSSPYNAYCPMDLLAGSRSVAGCPAVAMGMIVDNLETAMSMYFYDTDDYYHNYHEYYWIDDDCVAHDFPSWSELNALLDTLEYHYVHSTPLTDSDKAALVAASGYACKQVFTASVSGTFGVDQAYDAYLRFGFDECQLLDSTSENLFVILPQNMMNALPAHLAIVDAGWQYGHNIVVDGYNTDDFYHFNFGWGGSYNGWYQFPLSGMPYSMNVIEGIIVDIGTGQASAGGEGSTVSPALAISAGPNPSSSVVFTVVEVPEQCPVTLEVYGLDGRLVEVLSSGTLDAGTSEFVWDAAGAPPGVYLLRACCPSGAACARVTLTGR
jgi:hypothetical protein